MHRRYSFEGFLALVEVVVMRAHDVAAANLSCEYCARVYHAILNRGGVSWLNEIMRDTGIRRKRLKRHLEYLLVAKLIEHDVFGFRIPRMI